MLDRQSTLLLSFFIALRLTSSQTVNVDVTILASYLGELMNETLGVSQVQRKVDQLNFEPAPIDGEAFINILSANISKSIAARVNAVRRLKQDLESSLSDVTYNRGPVCCLYNINDLEQSSNYKSEVDPNNMCEIISPTAPEHYLSLPSRLVNSMKQNRDLVPDIKWQYVGTDKEGILSVYPALKLSSCGSLDPRFRPWFIETAQPYAKRILILLDKSRSMEKTFHSRRKIDIAVEAINVLLGTLAPTDRVGIVTFSNIAERPGGCFQEELALATQNNLRMLKDSFLHHVRTEGESVFGVGFQNAFQLLLESSSLSTPRADQDYVILFITDGEPKEYHSGTIKSVYDVIKKGNELINNTATIYSFGIGRNEVKMNILSTMASQNFTINNESLLPRPNRGMSFHITEPRMLQEKILSFHENYHKSNTSNEPTFSVPYVDTGGLGLIFTVGLPVFHPQRQTLFGVVAVDITLQEVFTEAIYYESDGESYIFVIDGSGRVITHPLMPRPSNNTDQPKFIKISELERHNGVDDIIRSMILGESGSKSVDVRKVIPLGNAVQTSPATMTYHWRPIEGANFSVCFVHETNKSDVTVKPQNIAKFFTRKSNFRYHRLDLETEGKVCQYFYQRSTMEESTVLFAPRAFAKPLIYESSTETPSGVARYKTFFNDLFSASSADDVSAAIGRHQPTANTFASNDVLSDVMWSSFVDEIWVNKSDNHVALRFVGTSTGIDRIFPGSRLPSDFDVTKRIWYELALANPAKAVFSAPYIDAVGAGNVISISQAILSPTSTLTPERKVIGVMGVDFSLNYLYSRLQYLYPNCSKNSGVRGEDGWYCILVDDRGNIILHEDYLDTETLNVKHISSDENLMSILREKKFVERLKCLDLDESVYRNWYRLAHNARLRAGNFGNPDRCSHYFMEPVPNTNIFFVARPNIAWCLSPDCPSYDPTHLCKNASHVSEDEWECPCNSPIQLDSCVNQITVDKSIPSCYPPRPQLRSFNECIPVTLERCVTPTCSMAVTESNCSGLVGCSWCHQTSTGGDLKEPFCSISEDCYNGLEFNRLPGYENRQECSIDSDRLNTVEIIIACIGGSVFALILMSICVVLLKKRKEKQEMKKQEQSRDYDEVPESPAGNRKMDSSPPSSPPGHKSHGEHRKHSLKPQVILSVVDTDGSEIIRKPVQLVNGAMTIGTPTPRRQSYDFDPKRPKIAPLSPKADGGNVDSKSESSTWSSGRDDSGRPQTSSGFSDVSAEFNVPRSRKRLPRTPDLLQTPVLRRIRNEKKAVKRKRTETEPSEKTNEIDLIDRASSVFNIKEQVQLDEPMCGASPRRWRSSEDMLRYSTMHRVAQHENAPRRHFNQTDDVDVKIDTSAKSENDCSMSGKDVKPFQVYL